MKCEDIVELAQSGESGVMNETGRQFIMEHVAQCLDCQDAIRAVEATRWLRNQPVEPANDELFARVMGAAVQQQASGTNRGAGFWIGTGVGGAVAAAFFAAVVALGLTGAPATQDTGPAEFFVSLTEPRDLNIAIDVDSALRGAQLSVSFFGGIELDGYASQRHLSWTTDLGAGVNKLTLPIIALDSSGGQVVVRLEHPDSQQEFLIQLRHDG
jgi:hypothetical protein